MEFLPPTPAKRRRLALSDAAKKAICVYKRDHPSAKPEDVATEIQQRFQLDEAPARRTIYDILKESNKWLSIDDPSEKTLHHKAGQHPQLEEALLMWIKDKKAHGVPLSDDLVAEQAKIFGAQFNVQDFAYSLGWLEKFKKRTASKDTLLMAKQVVSTQVALPTGEQLTDESIIAIVTGSTESEESEEDEQEGLETVMEPTQIKDAIAGGKAFLSYLEQNQVASGEEILTVMNLTDCLVDEEIKKRRQAKITEFLR